jgi:hypothetical protein
MLTLHDASIDDILECMRTHRTMCGYAFHDQCREWRVLAQWHAKKSTHGMQTDTFDSLPIVNDRCYVIILDAGVDIATTH